MPSPIPPTRFLRADLYPSLDAGTCSSPLAPPSRVSPRVSSRGSSLQVPSPRLHGRPWSSVIRWQQLRSVAPLGSGGFGSVYRAEYRGRTVALKRVKKNSRNRLASWQSFWAELNAAHLTHRNVVRVLAATTCVPEGCGGEASVGTILMEFVGCRNLQQVIYGSEELDRARRGRFSVDVARGLDFLHAHRVVHLDVKPANVLVSAEDVCKLADFGCSQKLDSGGAAAPSPLLGGTYTHRAPELLRGESVSPKADIFSLGVTLWQMTTREPPYTEDRQHVLYAVVAHHLRPSLHLHPDFHTQHGRLWGALLARCWSPEPRDRPTAPELLLDLQDMEVPGPAMESGPEDF